MRPAIGAPLFKFKRFYFNATNANAGCPKSEPTDSPITYHCTKDDKNPNVH